MEGVAVTAGASYTEERDASRRGSRTAPEEDHMAEKSKQPKEPKKKPQKTMMEKRKEKREKAATKHEE